MSSQNVLRDPLINVATNVLPKGGYPSPPTLLNRTEQKGSAWTLGLFACRRYSQVAPIAPWSGAAANQKSRALEALESQRRTSPQLDGVQVQL